MSNTIKHVWFDLGGTLYKETEAFNELHDSYRYQTYAGVAGISDLAIAKAEFLELYKINGSNSAVFRSLGKESGFWMKALDSMDFTSVLKPDSQVFQTLHELKERVPISIFTNFHKEKLVNLLEYLEIQPSWFQNLLSGDDIAERKPALDGFHEMIRLSRLNPEEIIYVGDRVDVDIKPAKSVGMKTCLIYSKSDEADFCVNTFDQLLSIAN